MEGKTVFITGGNRGIGAETAKVFAINGYNVIFTYRGHKNEAIAIRRECSRLGSPETHFIKMDSSNIVSINNAVRSLKSLLMGTKLDTFVSNAGVLRTCKASEANDAVITEVLEVNLAAPMRLFPKLLPFKPRISVFIGSDLAKEVKEICWLYSASKWGLRGYVQSLAKERHKVYLVNPNTTSTAMTGFEGVDPQLVAEVIYKASKTGYGKPSGSDIDVWDVL